MSIELLDLQSRYVLEAEQVITNLESSVKELIENSLDAKTKTIGISMIFKSIKSLEIVFRDFGFQGFSISDDGDGISNEDLELIGKISSKS